MAKNNYRSDKPHPNPILEQWLTEWKEEAVQKSSKMQFVYAKALSSLKKYPLPLRSGRECMILEFFGNTLCKMIDNRIAKENVVLHPQSQSSQSSGASSGSSVKIIEFVNLDSDSNDAPPKKSGKKRNKNKDGDYDGSQTTTVKKKKSRYVPAYRSGAYAILVTLFKKEETPSYRGYMLKSEVQYEAQEYCDSSFTRPDNPMSKYTAWNSMATVVNKGLVLRQGNPVKFTLTVEGRNLAASLLNADNSGQRNVPSSASSSESADDDVESVNDVPHASSRYHRFQLEPGRFEVILCVDTSETNAKCKQDEVIGELRKNGVNLEVIRLSVGDFVWICRGTDPVAGGSNRRLTISRSNDLILPYVVERKRSDDLAGSIKDGRFHEQKHRLKQSGLQPIYLLESYGQGDWGLAEGALSQAVANTQITNDFYIQETSSIRDTCAYLTHMTRLLTKLFQNKRLFSCTKEQWPSLKDSSYETFLMCFNDFNEFGVKLKNWTVSEMFAKHLMRIRGLSVERAYSIVQKYPTLKSLLRAYDDCDTEKEKENLLATLHYGSAGKTVGPAISRTIFKLYSWRVLQ